MEGGMTAFMLVLVVVAMSIRVRNNYQMRQFEKRQEKVRKERKMKEAEKQDIVI